MSYDKMNDINYWRCQFCGKESQEHLWKKNHCPKCGKKYDPLLAQEMED